ncbi:MAG: hypothetical protein GC159_01870 [Phycisphaera sp.]|nr:hypothetical protein [Phycisphaera sp.]
MVAVDDVVMTQPEWYQRKRQELEVQFEAAQPRHDKRAVQSSPSGRYSVEITPHARDKNRWNVTKAVVSCGTEIVTTVLRNFGSFPMSWAERHPSGHDYLICGEDYQGQTVVELDTGRRADYIDPRAEKGWAFCWAAHFPTSDGKRLFVDGCYWACPYELVVYDFADPMALPYPELQRVGPGLWETHGFDDEGAFTADINVDVRRSDGVLLDDLPDEEAEDLQDNHAGDIEERRLRLRVHRDGRIERMGFVER